MTSPDCSSTRCLAARTASTRQRRRFPGGVPVARAACALRAHRAGVALALVADPRRDHALRRQGHPRRGRAADRGGHGILVPADQGRRAPSTTRRPPPAVKALFATGFFRDVRLEVEDGVLLVIVQERPTISKVDISGNKEFDTDTLKKALKEIGLAEARIFDRRRSIAPSRKSSASTFARPLRGEGHGDGHAAGAQPRRHQHRRRGRRRREDRADQHRRRRARSARASCSA